MVVEGMYCKSQILRNQLRSIVLAVPQNNVTKNSQASLKQIATELESHLLDCLQPLAI